MADNIGTVGAIYQAFGQGDVPFILGQLDDGIVWERGVRTTGLPWLVEGSGKQHVVSFFQALAAGLAFEVFEPTFLGEQGDTVVAVIREDARQPGNRSVDRRGSVRPRLAVRPGRQGRRVPSHRRLGVARGDRQLKVLTTSTRRADRPPARSAPASTSGPPRRGSRWLR